ncbi:MAG TPA: hypothetical protein VIM11_23280 [Tepidisphaeraceae bacterium]
MNDHHRQLLENLTNAFRDGQYDLAATIALDALESAAAISPDEVKDLARSIVENQKLSPIFPDTARAAYAAGFFESLFKHLEKHLTLDSVIVAAFAVKVAPFYLSQGLSSRAVELLESSARTFATILGPRHPQTRLARSTLAIQLRNLGKFDRADAVFVDTGVCDHLRPVQDYIRSLGVRVLDVATPWSKNCRTWVYFDRVVLDVDSLKSRFNLPEIVAVHSHRGTHDGSEHGLVCQADHDALMGAHPETAGGIRFIG